MGPLNEPPAPSLWVMPEELFAVRLIPLSVIPTPGGPVLKMLRQDDPHFASFGELYFSEVEGGAVKAWKCHTRQTQNLTVPRGRLRVVLFDARPDSSSFGRLAEVVLGRPEAYALLSIPPGICYGFTALGQEAALICNCADIPHDPAESSKFPSDCPDIPYIWQPSGA